MRPQDTYPFDRNARALILRIGTIKAISGDGKRIDVDVPKAPGAAGGTIPNVPLTTAIPAPTVGAKVAIILDRDSALAIGQLK